MTSERSPGLDCISGRHLMFDIVDRASLEVIGGWCAWCGGGSYDPDRISDDGEPIGFDPMFRVRIPDEFFRRLSV